MEENKKIEINVSIIDELVAVPNSSNNESIAVPNSSNNESVTVPNSLNNESVTVPNSLNNESVTVPNSLNNESVAVPNSSNSDQKSEESMSVPPCNLLSVPDEENTMDELRMYILVNKDLGMTKGKIASQVAHGVRCVVHEI